jgi:hypothetical protein
MRKEQKAKLAKYHADKKKKMDAIIPKCVLKERDRKNYKNRLANKALRRNDPSVRQIINGKPAPKHVAIPKAEAVLTGTAGITA